MTDQTFDSIFKELNRLQAAADQCGSDDDAIDKIASQRNRLVELCIAKPTDDIEIVGEKLALLVEEAGTGLVESRHLVYLGLDLVRAAAR